MTSDHAYRTWARLAALRISRLDRDLSARRIGAQSHSFGTMADRATDAVVIKTVALYWAVSIIVVFLNKAMLARFFGDAEHGSHELPVNAPVFISWYQVCMVVLGGCPSRRLHTGSHHTAGASLAFWSRIKPPRRDCLLLQFLHIDESIVPGRNLTGSK